PAQAARAAGGRLVRSCRRRRRGRRRRTGAGRRPGGRRRPPVAVRRLSSGVYVLCHRRVASAESCSGCIQLAMDPFELPRTFLMTTARFLSRTFLAAALAATAAV